MDAVCDHFDSLNPKKKANKLPTVIGAYFSQITEDDYKSSSGVELKTPAAILQQDRANAHKNSIQEDSFFTTAEKRKLLPGMLRRGAISDSVKKLVKEKEEFGIYVRILDTDGSKRLLVEKAKISG